MSMKVFVPDKIPLQASSCAVGMLSQQWQLNPLANARNLMLQVSHEVEPQHTNTGTDNGKNSQG